MQPILRFLLAYALLKGASAQTPFSIKWSPTTHGPDGPWFAVDMQVGSRYNAANDLDWFYLPSYPTLEAYHSLLPESICHDKLLAPPACRNLTAQPFYNPSGSNVTGFISDSINPMRPLQANFENNYYSDEFQWPSDDLQDWIVVNTPMAYPNASTTTDQVPVTYPKVQIHPYVNLFSLGSIFSPDDGYNNSLSSQLNSSVISSIAFALHIGSVAYQIPPSLWFGGFDQNRAVGPISAFPITQTGNGVAQTALAGLSLGTAEGSPVVDQPGIGLLGMPSVQVTINPAQPYLILPKATCDALAAQLPVRFDDRTNLYLWQTAEASYSNLVKSATYVDFVFAQDKLSIKVPLGLLNLTLEPPLAPGKDSVSYFPCYAQTNVTAGYSLGRAFLQAAFFSVNWWPDSDGAPTFFLAQAPGPNVAHNSPIVVSIAYDQTNLSGSSVDWAGTWHGVWDVKDAANSTQGLSKGAIAGIVVGSVIGFALIVAAAVLIWKRQRKQGHEPVAQEDKWDHDVPAPSAHVAHAKHDPPMETYRETAVSPPTLPVPAAVATPAMESGQEAPAELGIAAAANLAGHASSPGHLYEPLYEMGGAAPGNPSVQASQPGQLHEPVYEMGGGATTSNHNVNELA